MKMADFHISYKTKRRAVIGISFFVLLLLYLFKNVSFLIRGLSTVGLLVVFYITDHLLSLEFKKKHYFFIVIIAFSSFLLSPLYFVYPNYDKIQHFIQPMMFASIFFHAVSRLKLDYKWRFVFVFFIITSLIGIFEIGEYYLDLFFDLKLQGVFLRNLQGLEKYDILQDRIEDTMTDMSIGVLGTLFYVFSVGGAHYYKRMRARGWNEKFKGKKNTK